MKFLVNDLITGKFKVFDTELEATQNLQEVKAAYLERESYRFTIAREVIDGNNTTWMSADLENDPADGSYHVFNTLTGEHEPVSGLQNAIERREEIKAEFAVASNLVVTQISDEEALTFTNIFQ